MREPPVIHRVPYGHEELEFTVPPWFDVDVVESAPAEPLADLEGAARDALRSPLGSPPLRELARLTAARVSGRAARVVIAVTDLTRASPDAALVPPMLDELNAGGIADADVLVIVGVGLHRPTTDAEKREKLGNVVDRVRVVDSDGRDPSKWADLGPIPPYGVPGLTQKRVAEADLVLATGVVEPHQYAGYSGARKTVAIGCCGEPVITATHGMRFLEDPGVRLARIDGNPFHETVREIARRAGLRFCVNVVNDDRERAVAVAAGEPDAVLARLVAVAAEVYTRPITKQYDVVVAGVGAPKDVNLYQASRAATYLRFAPTPVVRAGGSIVIPAQLPEGAGEGAGERRFLAALERAESPAAVVEAARRHFEGGEQRAVMVALTLQHCQVIVAASEAPEIVRLAKLRAAVDVEEALDLAYEHIGRPQRASLLIVPRALHTLPVVREAARA
ncbi:MAG: nickel-dependent lactate racemase [Chloroflexota bacterium]|nr:nickel-dependent lactate racemase [Chloroflexota bacterium]